MTNTRTHAEMQEINHEETKRLARRLAAMPGELVNMITAMVMEVPWPKGNSAKFAPGASPLQVDLVKAENPQLKAAAKHALSKKVFVNFSIWKCSLSARTRTRALYHLPRVMSEEDYQCLQNLSDISSATIDINFYLGCHCKRSRRAYNTIFFLDKLTTLMFVHTFHDEALVSWQKVHIKCHINSSSAATISEEFLDFALKVIPASRNPKIALSGHPNIKNPVSWVGDRLVINPTNSQQVVQNELQLGLIEEISQHGLFIHQFWLHAAHAVIVESLKRCLSCQLDMHERNTVGQDPLLEPLLPDMERLLRVRLRACHLFFRGLIDCLEKGDSIDLHTQLFTTYSDGHQYCLLPGRRDPYASERNDLARCIWIVNSFRAEIVRIPYLHDQLLHLIYMAVLHVAFVKMKLAQACARNPNLHYRQPLKVGDLWFDYTNGSHIPNAESIMEPHHFMEAFDQDLEWLRDHQHLSLQTAEDRMKWKDQCIKANEEYTKLTQAES